MFIVASNRTFVTVYKLAQDDKVMAMLLTMESSLIAIRNVFEKSYWLALKLLMETSRVFPPRLS